MKIEIDLAGRNLCTAELSVRHFPYDRLTVAVLEVESDTNRAKKVACDGSRHPMVEVKVNGAFGYGDCAECHSSFSGVLGIGGNPMCALAPPHDVLRVLTPQIDLHVGVARASELDDWSRERGRRIAIGRAMAALTGRGDNRPGYVRLVRDGTVEGARAREDGDAWWCELLKSVGSSGRMSHMLAAYVQAAGRDLDRRRFLRAMAAERHAAEAITP